MYHRFRRFSRFAPMDCYMNYYYNTNPFPYFETTYCDTDSLDYLDPYISLFINLIINNDIEETDEDEDDELINLKDYGPKPFVVNIEDAAKQNKNFRTALWTGNHLQVTLMSINVGESIGLENHPNLDQFIRIEEGEGLVEMGDRKDNLNFKEKVYDDYAFIIPAGKWHNLTNTGDEPLKLYSIYAPPQHPFGTVHATKQIAQASEEHNHY